MSILWTVLQDTGLLLVLVILLVGTAFVILKALALCSFFLSSRDNVPPPTPTGHPNASRSGGMRGGRRLRRKPAVRARIRPRSRYADARRF